MQDDKTTDPFEKRTSPFRGIKKKCSYLMTFEWSCYTCSG